MKTEGEKAQDEVTNARYTGSAGQMGAISRFRMTLVAVLRCTVLVTPTARGRKGRKESGPTWNRYSGISSCVLMAKEKTEIKYF